MAFYVFSALIIALLALPLEIAAELNVDRGPNMRVKIMLAGMTVYYNANVIRRGDNYELDIRRGNSARQYKKTLKQLKRDDPNIISMLPVLRRAGVTLMRNVKTEKLSLKMRLGTGDAATSALLCGLAGILSAGFCAAINVRPEIEISPDYARATFALSAKGMFYMRTGHIIGAGLTGIAIFCKGAFDKWRMQHAIAR